MFCENGLGEECDGRAEMEKHPCRWAGQKLGQTECNELGAERKNFHVGRGGRGVATDSRHVAPFTIFFRECLQTCHTLLQVHRDLCLLHEGGLELKKIKFYLFAK